MIQLQCECGKRYTVPEKFAGKKTRCKVCSVVLVIPDAPAAEASSEEAAAGQTATLTESTEAAAASSSRLSSAKSKVGRRVSKKLPGKKAAGKKVASSTARKTTKIPKRRLSERRGAGGSKKKRERPAAKVAGGAEGKSKSLRLVVLVALLLAAAAGVGAYQIWFTDDGAQSSQKPPSSQTSAADSSIVSSATRVDRNDEENVDGGLEEQASDDNQVAEREDKARTSLSAFPSGTNILVHVDLEALAAFADNSFAAFLPLPGLNAGERLRAGIPPAVNEAGFDVFGEGNSLWFGVTLNPSEPQREEQRWLMVFETEDQSELLEGLEAANLVGTNEDRDGRDVCPIYHQEAEKKRAEALGIELTSRFVTALSDTRLLATNELTFDAALESWDDGESIEENELLSDLTGGFEPSGFLSVVAVVPEDFKSDAEASIKELNDAEAVFVDVGYTEEGVNKTLDIAIAARFGAEESATKLQSLLKASMESLPPNIEFAKPLLARLVVEAEGSTLRLWLGLRPADGPVLMMLAQSLMSGQTGGDAPAPSLLGGLLGFPGAAGRGNSAPPVEGLPKEDPPQPIDLDGDDEDDFDIEEEEEDGEMEEDEEDDDDEDEDDFGLDKDMEDDEDEDGEDEDDDFGLDEDDEDEMEEDENGEDDEDEMEEDENGEDEEDDFELDDDTA